MQLHLTLWASQQPPHPHSLTPTPAHNNPNLHPTPSGSRKNRALPPKS